MIVRTISSMRNSPVIVFIGLIAGFAVAMGAHSLSDAGISLYDSFRPVATDWKVTNAGVIDDTLVLYGTMVKVRNCIFVPPTIARDSSGTNYQIESGSHTSGKTWAAGHNPQKWGPWYVKGAVGKRLTFINVYLCGASRPVVVELGIFGSDKG
jgi:hypothetical protein